MKQPNFGPKYGILRAAWDEYEKKVIPKDASQVQRTETRRGFYAGAITVMASFEEISEDKTSEAIGVMILTSIKRELDEYKENTLK